MKTKGAYVNFKKGIGGKYPRKRMILKEPVRIREGSRE